MVAIATGHHNLGIHLDRNAHKPADAFFHYLTAALIYALAGVYGVDELARLAAFDMRALDADATVIAGVADLSEQVARVPGVDLDQLLAALAPDRDTAEQTLQQLMSRVRMLVAAPSVAVARYLAAWDPVVAAILAADDGDPQAAAALDDELARFQDVAGGMLAAALRRVRAGETGPELTSGLGEIGTTIVARALDARNGKVAIPASLWPAMRLGPLLGDIVEGAGGANETASHARQILARMAYDPTLASLARTLDRILDGDRDPGLADQLGDPVHQAIIMTVLHHIGR